MISILLKFLYSPKNWPKRIDIAQAVAHRLQMKLPRH